MLKLMGKKIFSTYADFFYLPGPRYFIEYLMVGIYKVHEGRKLSHIR